jgi:hypothetical protein
MLDVSVAGEIFVAPGAALYRGHPSDHGAGVLFIALNHGRRAVGQHHDGHGEARWAERKMISTHEDISADRSEDRRGLAGFLPVWWPAPQRRKAVR